jgi:hypothetical protein
VAGNVGYDPPNKTWPTMYPSPPPDWLIDAQVSSGVGGATDYGVEFLETYE